MIWATGSLRGGKQVKQDQLGQSDNSRSLGCRLLLFVSVLVLMGGLIFRLPWLLQRQPCSGKPLPVRLKPRAELR